VVTPLSAFFDTSVLLGGLIELGPASRPADLRHFVGLRRHGVAVMSAPEFAKTLPTTGS